MQNLQLILCYLRTVIEITRPVIFLSFKIMSERKMLPLILRALHSIQKQQEYGLQSFRVRLEGNNWIKSQEDF